MAKLERYDFDGDVQDDILRLMAKDATFARASVRLIEPQYFTGQDRKQVAKLLLDFQEKYKVPPTRGQMQTQLKQMTTKGLIQPELYDAQRDFVESIYRNQPSSARDFTVEVVQEFARHRAWELAIYRSLPLLDEGKYEEVAKLMKEAERVGVSVDDGVYWYFEASHERITRRGTEDEIEVFPTGIIEIDTLIRRGGVGRGEVFCWLGPKGGGKSLAMAQMARRTVFGGHRVLFLSFEMSEDQVADRQDAGFSGISAWELEENRDDLLEEIGKLSVSFPKSLAIKRFATKQFTIDRCRDVLESLRVEGWRPDMLILDYLSIVKAKDTRKERHEQIQEIAEDFRGLCVEYDAAGHTANQINRSGSEKVIATGADAAGSWDQLATMDYVATINQTPEEKTRNKVRLFMDKVRDGVDKVVVELDTCYEKMIFARRTNKTKKEVIEDRKKALEEAALAKEREDKGFGGMGGLKAGKGGMRA